MKDHLPRHAGEAGRGKASVRTLSQAKIMIFVFRQDVFVTLPLPASPV